MTILILDKVYSKQRILQRTHSHFIMRKILVYLEYIIIIKFYVYNDSFKIHKQREKDKPTFLVADFSISLSIFDGTRRQIICKDIESQKIIINPFN